MTALMLFAPFVGFLAGAILGTLLLIESFIDGASGPHRFRLVELFTAGAIFGACAVWVLIPAWLR